MTLTAWLGLLCEEAVWSVSRESSGCSVRVRTRGGAFMFRRSMGGTDWIRSKSRGWENRGSPSSPVEGVRRGTVKEKMIGSRRWMWTVWQYVFDASFPCTLLWMCRVFSVINPFNKVLLTVLTCDNDPFWHLHQRRVNGQGLLRWHRPHLLLRGHLEGLRDSHALADTLCVLQLILDAVHLSHLGSGGGEGWPTHPACRHIK